MVVLDCWGLVCSFPRTEVIPGQVTERPRLFASDEFRFASFARTAHKDTARFGIQMTLTAEPVYGDI